MDSMDVNPGSEKKYLTGLQPLDLRLGMEGAETRGLPSGSLILLHYPASSELGSLFAMKLLYNFLVSVPNSQAFYMHSAKPKELLLRQFISYGWNFETFINSGRFNLVDMWEITASHAASSSKIGEIDIRKKTYLKQAYNKMILQRKNSKNDYFSVVDNLLWMKEEEIDSQPSQLMGFFKDISKMIFKIGGVHFWLLPKGTLEKVAERLIMSSVTGIIDFETTQVGNAMRDHFHISKMSGIIFTSEILEITYSMDEGFRIESTGKV